MFGNYLFDKEIFRSDNLVVTLEPDGYSTMKVRLDFYISDLQKDKLNAKFANIYCDIVAPTGNRTVFMIQEKYRRRQISGQKFKAYCEKAAPQVINWMMYNNIDLFRLIME